MMEYQRTRCVYCIRQAISLHMDAWDAKSKANKWKCRDKVMRRFNPRNKSFWIELLTRNGLESNV